MTHSPRLATKRNINKSAIATDSFACQNTTPGKCLDMTESYESLRGKRKRTPNFMRDSSDCGRCQPAVKYVRAVVIKFMGISTNRIFSRAVHRKQFPQAISVVWNIARFVRQAPIRVSLESFALIPRMRKLFQRNVRKRKSALTQSLPAQVKIRTCCMAYKVFVFLGILEVLL